eukprot:5761680-Prymnesium_polylepis.1
MDLVVELSGVGRLERRFNGVQMLLTVKPHEEPPHDYNAATNSPEDVGRVEDALVYCHHCERRRVARCRIARLLGVVCRLVARRRVARCLPCARTPHLELSPDRSHELGQLHALGVHLIDALHRAEVLHLVCIRARQDTAEAPEAPPAATGHSKAGRPARARARARDTSAYARRVAARSVPTSRAAPSRSMQEAERRVNEGVLLARAAAERTGAHHIGAQAFEEDGVERTLELVVIYPHAHQRLLRRMVLLCLHCVPQSLCTDIHSRRRQKVVVRLADLREQAGGGELDLGSWFLLELAPTRCEHRL